MKDFYEIDDWKQCELLFELIERIGTTMSDRSKSFPRKKARHPMSFGRRCAWRAESRYAAFLNAS
jgi:hypothetical protein